MQQLEYSVRKSLRCYVNCIMTDTSDAPDKSFSLPLYADGYPGIMFQKSDNGLFLLPKGKELSELFLYGQTLDPVTLSTKGPYQFVVLQLYPFASKHLLNVDPKILNDECYDLSLVEHVDMKVFHEKLLATNDIPTQIEIMSDLAETLIESYQIKDDDRIQNAINHIIRNNGVVKISEIRDLVHLTERTFERNFVNQIGITPKQFCKIIQFQHSLEKIENTDTFTSVAFDSGYADQSHFIRVFKSYTGLSPKQYRLQATRS